MQTQHSVSLSAKEIRSLISCAINLPANGKVVRVNEFLMRHMPETRMKIEQVRVLAHGVLYRSRLVHGTWCTTEAISGHIDD